MTGEHNDLADVLRRLAADLGRAQHLPGRVAQLADVARRALGADGVGLMLLDDDRLRLWGPPPRPPARSRTPSCAGRGTGDRRHPPRPGVAVAVAVKAIEHGRWPALVEPLRGRVAGVLSVPAHVGGAAVGILNVPCQLRRSWAPEDERLLRALARIAGAVLATAGDDETGREPRRSARAGSEPDRRIHPRRAEAPLPRAGGLWARRSLRAVRGLRQEQLARQLYPPLRADESAWLHADLG